MENGKVLENVYFIDFANNVYGNISKYIGNEYYLVELYNSKVPDRLAIATIPEIKDYILYVYFDEWKKDVDKLTNK